MTNEINIHVVSGDDYLKFGDDDRRWKFPVTKAGVAIDITGCEFTFLVKRNRWDDDEDALITKIVDDGLTIATPQTGDTKGILYIDLERGDTASLAGKYPCELQGRDAVGIITLFRGTFRVERDMIVGA